jgi:hypothetical protein
MPDIFVRIQHGVRSDGRGNYRYRPATADDLLAALCERGWRLRLTDDHDTYQAPSANDPNGPTCPRCFDDRWAPQPEADAYDCVHCGFGISGNEFANGLDANEYVANGTVPMDDPLAEQPTPQPQWLSMVTAAELISVELNPSGTPSSWTAVQAVILRDLERGTRSVTPQAEYVVYDESWIDLGFPTERVVVRRVDNGSGRVPNICCLTPPLPEATLTRRHSDPELERLLSQEEEIERSMRCEPAPLWVSPEPLNLSADPVLVEQLRHTASIARAVRVEPMSVREERRVAAAAADPAPANNPWGGYDGRLP